MKLTFGLVTFLIIFTNAFSQEADLDKLFQEARNNAFSNNYSTARKMCYQILQKNNKYFDARILLARTFSWEHKFDSARYHLRTVLRQDPYALDAYLALADVETWSGNCNGALVLTDTALAKIPNNYDLWIKKVKACLCKEDAVCARSTINSLLKVYPMNLEVQNLLNQTKQGAFKNRLIVEHSVEYYREPLIRSWHVTSFQYERDGKKGTVVAKVNAGQIMYKEIRFFHPGAIQFEADAYPLLGKGFYTYLNYGYSPDSLFPKHRTGFELFKILNGGTEFSLGGRYFQYHDGTDVWVYTGSLSKYMHSWWFSFRPYLSEINKEWNQSYFLFARKYSTQYNYIGTMIGYGISPDFIPNTIGTYDVYHLNSYQMRFDIQHRLGTHFLFRALMGYARDQYIPDEYRHRANLQLYLGYMF